jgi:hypothetical protein
LTESHQLNLDFLDRGDHPKIYCKGDVVTRDGRKSTCDFNFVTKLVVDKLSNEKYVVMLRSEPFRELLLIPRPDNKTNNSNNYGHYTNETLVQQETFWEDLLSKRQSLNFHSIAINYGAWETAQSQNKYEQECHAHVHLYFTSDTWNGVKEKLTDSDILLEFNARDYPKPNYLPKDCAELEEKRLRSAEHLLMLKVIYNLKGNIKENNALMLKAISNLNDNIKENNKNIKALIKAIESMGKSYF